MSPRLKQLSIPALRWVLGIVVMIQSLHFVFSHSTAHFFAKIGVPLWVRPVLGGIEILAAVLFVLPATLRVGGYLLLIVFVLAIAIHVVHGQYDVESLLVYCMAVFVCVAHPGQPEQAAK
jgi:uncharacterized membrane protein YphA (DoxX/SURF4 family)